MADAPALLNKNLETSYGLTLVAGLPFAEEASARLAQAIARLPAPVERYQPGWLHLTLAAPLRGRYRPEPPLRRAELPNDFPGFLDSLAELLAGVPPFDLAFYPPQPDPHGGWACPVDLDCDLPLRLAGLIAGCPGFDPPPGSFQPHVSLGYGPRPAAPRPAATGAGAAPQPWFSTRVEAIALVHYARRTLERVVGRLDLPLGRATRRPPEIERLGFG